MSATETLPRAALTIPEAARSLGISLSSFRRYVLPEVKAARLGRTVVISHAELVRWLDERGILNATQN